MLPKMHPLRVMLEAAAAGHPPTSAQLDEVEQVAKQHLPAGQTFAGVRRDLLDGARRAAALAERGDFITARRVAADYAWRIADKLPDEARQLDTSVVEHESADVIAARMFGGH